MYLWGKRCASDDMGKIESDAAQSGTERTGGDDSEICPCADLSGQEGISGAGDGFGRCGLYSGGAHPTLYGGHGWYGKNLVYFVGGVVFWETPCSLEQPTGLYSKTEERTTIYRIPLQAYDKLLDENKTFRDVILRSCAKKLLIMRHEIENLTFNSCKDRLKRLFCSTADTSRLEEGAWYSLKVHYTQYEISTIVGGARVTVSKLINELCLEGFIRMLNRNIQINATEYARFTRWMEEHKY